MAGEWVWQPSPEWMEESRIVRFIRQCGLADLTALQERAAADPDWFWDAGSRLPAGERRGAGAPDSRRVLPTG